MIEAITENLDAKLEMWRTLDPIVKQEALFASNTSSLGVIHQAAVTERPEHFLGLHFFNPAQVMPLLEVVQCITTATGTLEAGLRVRPQPRTRRSSTRRTRPASSSTGC